MNKIANVHKKYPTREMNKVQLRKYPTREMNKIANVQLRNIPQEK